MDQFKSIVFDCREKTTEDFDKENQELIDEVLKTIGKTHSLKLFGALHSDEFIDGDKIDCFALLSNAEDFLISSFHMARQRAINESFTLNRNALELAATAIHIFKDKEIYKKFVNFNYKSTKSISFASKMIPVLGKLWGVLSQLAVHINHRAFGSTIEGYNDKFVKRSFSINWDVRERDEIKDYASLIQIALTGAIISKAFELVFMEQSNVVNLKSQKEKGSTELRIPGTNYVYWSDCDNDIRKYHSKFTGMPEKFKEKASE